MARVLHYLICRCSFHLLCLPYGFINLGMMQSQFIVPIVYLPDKYLSSGIYQPAGKTLSEALPLLSMT